MPDTALARAGSTDFTLRIVATTDLHVQISPFDYFTDRPAPGTGFAHAAALIRELRTGAANSLLLDNGDFLQGSAMGDYVAEAGGIGPTRAHPMIAAMNAVGYDAATLGNHEFNYGLDFLAAALAAARFPVVSANLLDATGEAPLLPAHVMLDRVLNAPDGRRQPIRIAVTGFLPPQVVTWDRSHLTGRATTRGIVETARCLVPAARAAGADLVIALCHAGIGDGSDDPVSENAALALAAVPGIDAVIAGHSHQVFPGPEFDRCDLPGVDVAAGLLAGKPACMAGSGGSHVGLIDLVLHHEGGRWAVTSGHGNVVAPGRNGPQPPCPDVLQAVSADHAATRRHLARPVGHLGCALHSHFTLVAGTGAHRLVAQAQAWHVQRSLAGGAFAHLPLVSAAPPFRAGGRSGPDNFTDLAPGPLLLRHLADLCPYPNTLRVLRLTGAEISAWLERSASIFNRLVPGVPDQPLARAETPVYTFDLLEGLSYVIDPSAPAQEGTATEAPRAGSDAGAVGGRVRDIRLGRRPLRPDERVLVVTNSYRAAGGGGFPGCTLDRVVLRTTATIRQIVEQFLAETGPYSLPPDPVWRFAPLPGTSAVFDTGRGAAAHLPNPGLTALGPGPDGFLRMRIDF